MSNVETYLRQQLSYHQQQVVAISKMLQIDIIGGVSTSPSIKNSAKKPVPKGEINEIVSRRTRRRK